MGGNSRTAKFSLKTHRDRKRTDYSLPEGRMRLVALVRHFLNFLDVCIFNQGLIALTWLTACHAHFTACNYSQKVCRAFELILTRLKHQGKN